MNTLETLVLQKAVFPFELYESNCKTDSHSRVYGEDFCESFFFCEFLRYCLLCKGGFLFTHDPIETLHVIAQTDFFKTQPRFGWVMDQFSFLARRSKS